MRCYKVLAKGGEPNHGGSGQYHLPTKREDGTWKPGKWMPAIEGEIVPCENGYHLCRPDDLVLWLGPEIYEAEYKGDRVDGDYKIVVRQVRLLRRVETWNERTAREFACWCVRQIWHLLDDERSKNAVVVAEKYARGEATDEELDAACDAAWVAAWNASWTAPVAAVVDAARVAAMAAGRAAVVDMATAAAMAAAAATAADMATAMDAARDAQTKHLLEVLEERDNRQCQNK